MSFDLSDWNIIHTLQKGYEPEPVKQSWLLLQVGIIRDSYDTCWVVFVIIAVRFMLIVFIF
jgi:hypothetical protein